MRKVLIVCGLLAGLLASVNVAQEARQTFAGEWADRASRGKQVYEHWCLPCHGKGPQRDSRFGIPGTLFLQQRYKDSQPAVLTERKDLTPGVIKYFVRYGFNVMPPIRKTEISDEDLDAVVQYLCPDPKSLDHAAALVDAGKIPSRLGRNLPLIFDPIPAPPGTPANSKTAIPETLTERQGKGKVLYERACGSCHGEGGAGTLSLARRLRELNRQFDSLPAEMKAAAQSNKRVGIDEAELAKRDNLAPDYILCVVRNGVRTMPQYPPLEISSAEIDLVSAYLTRNNPVEIPPVARGADCQPLE